MALDPTTYKGQLTAQASSGETSLKIQPDDEIRATLADGDVAFLQIFTAARSEIVLAHSIEDDEIVYSRGYSGTNAQVWPCDACVVCEKVVDGPVCVDEASDADDTSATSVSIRAGKGVEVEMDGDTFVISLTPTGVVAGSHSGLTVDECGRVTNVDPGWPNAAQFNPCACGDSE